MQRLPLPPGSQRLLQVCSCFATALLSRLGVWTGIGPVELLSCVTVGCGQYAAWWLVGVWGCGGGPVTGIVRLFCQCKHGVGLWDPRIVELEGRRV